MKSRRAASLAELLVIMSACSVILTLSAVLMHRVMRVQTSSREYLALQRNCLRLSEQFRRDVQDASEASSTKAELPEGTLVQFETAAGETVEYQAADGVVRRFVRQGEETKSREEYAFHSHVELSIEQPQTGLIGLTVVVPVKLQVVARLGSNHRFAKPAAAEATP